MSEESVEVKIILKKSISTLPLRSVSSITLPNFYNSVSGQFHGRVFADQLGHLHLAFFDLLLHQELRWILSQHYVHDFKSKRYFFQLDANLNCIHK